MEERVTKTIALFDLTGQVALVTGGNGGIGRGIALGLAEAGAAVAVFGRNDEKNQRVLSELKTIGVPALAVKVDMTQRAALEPALNTVESELGSISILVNNAGNVSLSGGEVSGFGFKNISGLVENGAAGRRAGFRPGGECRCSGFCRSNGIFYAGSRRPRGHFFGDRVNAIKRGLGFGVTFFAINQHLDIHD